MGGDVNEIHTILAFVRALEPQTHEARVAAVHEALRESLADRGIPHITALAQALGVARQRVSAQVSALCRETPPPGVVQWWGDVLDTCEQGQTATPEQWRETAAKIRARSSCMVTR